MTKVILFSKTVMPETEKIWGSSNSGFDKYLMRSTYNATADFSLHDPEPVSVSENILARAVLDMGEVNYAITISRIEEGSLAVRVSDKEYLINESDFTEVCRRFNLISLIRDGIVNIAGDEIQPIISALSMYATSIASIDLVDAVGRDAVYSAQEYNRESVRRYNDENPINLWDNGVSNEEIGF